MFDKIKTFSTIGQLFQHFNIKYMSQTDDEFVVEGLVSATRPGNRFMVKITTEGFEGHEILAHISGKIRMNHIRIVEGDRVTIALDPSDMEKGRITYRHSIKRNDIHGKFRSSPNMKKSQRRAT